MILVQNYTRNNQPTINGIDREKRLEHNLQKTLFQQLKFVGLLSLVKEEFGQKAPSILAALTVSKMPFILDLYKSNHRRLIFTMSDYVDESLRTKSEDFLERIYFHSVPSVDTAEGIQFNSSNIDIFLYTKETTEVAVIVTLSDLDKESEL